MNFFLFTSCRRVYIRRPRREGPISKVFKDWSELLLFTERLKPMELHAKARRLLDLLDGAGRIDDLKIPPGNRLEALKGDLKGLHSVRTNDQWRIIFRWVDGDAEKVQIVDYH